jgi:hypothetical protein
MRPAQRGYSKGQTRSENRSRALALRLLRTDDVRERDEGAHMGEMDMLRCCTVLYIGHDGHPSPRDTIEGSREFANSRLERRWDRAAR